MKTLLFTLTFSTSEPRASFRGAENSGVGVPGAVPGGVYQEVYLGGCTRQGTRKGVPGRVPGWVYIPGGVTRVGIYQEVLPGWV